MVVSDALCCRLDTGICPDVILAIADAANLQRNLYLVSQLLDLGLPVVVASEHGGYCEGTGHRH